MRKAARALEEQGAIVEEADPPLERAPDDDPRDVVAGDDRRSSMRSPERRARDGSRASGDRRARPAAHRSATIAAAYAARAELHMAMLGFHARYDLLLTPSMPLTAFEAGLVAPADGELRRRLDRLVALHLSVQPDPAAGRLGALRAGAQRPADRACRSSGPLRDDALVLRAARAVEQALPMPPPPAFD